MPAADRPAVARFSSLPSRAREAGIKCQNEAFRLIPETSSLVTAPSSAESATNQSDVQKNRAEARDIMEKLGYGPAKRLEVKVSERNIAIFRDPAVILIDQLKEIYIDGELDPIETANWFPKIYRKDYQIGLNLTGVGADDPDAQFYENYACGSQRNYTGYCNPELQKMFEQQSMETNQEERKRLVWEIDRRLQEDQARPIVYHLRFATCWQPRVKGLRMMVNSVFNGWRFEDVWLDE